MPHQQTVTRPPKYRSNDQGTVNWEVDSRCAWDVAQIDDSRLSQWLEEGTATVVKTGSHRTVYRVDLPAGCFFIKHYKLTDWRSRARSAIRRSKVIVEREICEHVALLGIDTIETAAIGQRPSGSLGEEGFLISPAIEDTLPLNGYIRNVLLHEDRKTQSVIRQRIAEELGKLLAKMHFGKLLHRDLHADNILIRVGPDYSVHLWIIDLLEVKILRRNLSSRQIQRNLSLLNSSLFAVSNRSDRLRFFRSYWNACQSFAKGDDRPALQLSGRSFRESTLAIGQGCHRLTTRAIHKYDKKWAKGNRRLIIADSNHVHCRGLSELGKEKLIAIRNHPEQLFGRGGFASRKESWASEFRLTFVSSASNWFVEYLEHDVSGWRRLFPITTRFALNRHIPDVRQAWEIGHAFLRRRIPTPKPILCVQNLDGNSIRQYLVTERIPHAITLGRFLKEILPKLSPGEKETWLRRFQDVLAIQIRKLHSWQYDHPELDAETILVSRNLADDCIWFTNLGRVRKRRHLSRKTVTAQLDRLNNSISMAVDKKP